MRTMRRTTIGVAAGALSLLAVLPAQASSHREALAVLNEPCADNTDFYAWVEPGTHDKLYLIGNFLPLHEPGQGNQGLRACNGYRYEFHIGRGASLADKLIYRVEFTNKLFPDVAPSPTDPPLGANEILWQITGGTETMRVTRINKATGATTVLGKDIPVTPNNHGPQTDRLVYNLGPFAGYNSGDPTSREVGLYDDAFRATYIKTLSNGARVWAGQADDPYYLDEKGIFDLVNLCGPGLFNIPGARTTPCEDVFTGFNLFSIALEIPMSEIFPSGIPHNGVLDTTSTDSLIRTWFGITRRATQIVSMNPITGYSGVGDFKQVGRQGNPLFNAGLVGTARQTAFVRTTPLTDVTRFGGDILYPVLVRDAELLGIYAALGIDPNAAGLKGPRVDIINAMNLGRPIPVKNGFTGDVITLDAAIGNDVVPGGVLEGGYPNGRMLIGGSAPDREHRDVSDVLISLIVAGNPLAGAGDGVDSNDKDYLTTFPFTAAPHQGLLEGHGGTNLP